MEELRLTEAFLPSRILEVTWKWKYFSIKKLNYLIFKLVNLAQHIFEGLDFEKIHLKDPQNR